MSNEYCRIKAPAWATGDNYTAFAVHKPIPVNPIGSDHGVTLVVHGLKVPRRHDGEQWLAINIQKHTRRATFSHDVCLSAEYGRALRDLLCEIYGPPI